MKILKPPHPLPEDIEGPSIFLAGSIEMGIAENWQVKIEKALADVSVTIFNPRRDDWDWTWVQSIDNPQFVEQVTWELNALQDAQYIAMYFDPTTKSPISLLEFGLYATSGKLIVCCPDGFWRKGNVDVVCERFGIKQAANLYELIEEVNYIFTK